jgi:hypothetical protein
MTLDSRAWLPHLGLVEALGYGRSNIIRLTQPTPPRPLDGTYGLDARCIAVEENPTMPLQPEKLPTMPLSELVQELHKREDSLDHLMAKAEIIRRQTQAQLDACAAQERACASQERNARYMLWSATAAAVSAFAAAVAVGIAVYTFLNAIVVE